MPDGLIGQAQGLSQMRTITRLQETKQGRISVFFDGEFDFSVDEETFVLHHLKVGQLYTEEEYQELRQDTQYRKAKEKAFLLLSHHSWTRRMLQERLERDFAPDCVQEVLDRVEELGLVNDADYALRCARDLVHLKHYALARVRQELAHRGIDRNDIEDALVEFEDWDESEAIREILQKKYAEALRQEKGRRRAFSALQRLGYDMGDIRSEIAAVVAQLPEPEEEPQEQEEAPDREQELRALLQKKYRNVLHDPKGIERAIRGMMRRGYSYGDIKSTLQELLEEE